MNRTAGETLTEGFLLLLRFLGSNHRLTDMAVPVTAASQRSLALVLSSLTAIDPLSGTLSKEHQFLLALFFFTNVDSRISVAIYDNRNTSTLAFGSMNDI